MNTAVLSIACSIGLATLTACGDAGENGKSEPTPTPEEAGKLQGIEGTGLQGIEGTGRKSSPRRDTQGIQGSGRTLQGIQGTGRQ
ncbi:MAG TPA: hypothetical protein VFQ35_15500 [Polyangiaceae bacterium]|nr:hypothetical protein [Polyangiaceae bacterium]